MRNVIISLAMLMLFFTPSYGMTESESLCNHVIVIDERIEPTCNSSGWSEGKHCKLCGEVLQKQLRLKSRHNGRRISAVEPTCTTAGQTEGMYCLDCKTIYEGGDIIPATGHRMEDLPEIKPTCTKSGLTYGRRCTVCGFSSIPQKNIPARHQGGVQTKITKAAIKKNGKVEKQCKTCGKILSREVIYGVKTMKLSPKRYAYNGGRKSPTVTIIDSKGKLIEPKYYRIVNKTNCKSVGTHQYEIRFKGNYKGTKILEFVIHPKASAIQSAVKRKHSLTLKWRKVFTETSGYELQFSGTKTFAKKSTKYFKITNNKTTKKTIKNLKSGKKYYAKIRTYKMVKGKTYYSSWSKVINVKTL